MSINFSDLTLIDEAYPAPNNTYECHAVDKDGGNYLIVWDIIDGFCGDDFSDACEWDKPSKIIRL